MKRRNALQEIRAYVREIIVEMFEDMKRSNSAWTVTDHAKYSLASGDKATQSWVRDVISELRDTYPYMSKRADELLLNFFKDNRTSLGDAKTINKAKFLHKESLEEMIETGVINTILEKAKTRLRKKQERNEEEDQFLDNFQEYIDFWRMLTPTMLALDFEDAKVRVDKHIERVRSLATRTPQVASRGR